MTASKSIVKSLEKAKAVKTDSVENAETRNDGLIEIRCPFKMTTKKGVVYPCNKLCARVQANSAGELRCGRCKLKFNFELSDESQRTFIKVQK